MTSDSYAQKLYETEERLADDRHLITVTCLIADYELDRGNYDAAFKRIEQAKDLTVNKFKRGNHSKDFFRIDQTRMQVLLNMRNKTAEVLTLAYDNLYMAKILFLGEVNNGENNKTVIEAKFDLALA